MPGNVIEPLVSSYYRHGDRGRIQFDFIVDRDSSLVPKSAIGAMGVKVIETPPYQHLKACKKTLRRVFCENICKFVYSHISHAASEDKPTDCHD